jgi:hypothetical protein
VPGNKLADRAAISPAIAGEEPALAIGPVVEALATEPVGAEQIAREAAISLAAAAGIGMPSAGVLGVITGRTLAPAAAAALPAWDTVEVAALVAVVVVAVDGEGKPPILKRHHRSAA